MARLDDAEYKATMGDPMTVLTPEDLDRPIALGDYVDAIPGPDLEGHDFSARTIDNVYRDPDKRFIHVVFSSATPQVLLAIVVDERRQSIHGHRLLDLRVERRLKGLGRLFRSPRS